jgi:glycosyltransferase involved in cell wall biosynthesis
MKLLQINVTANSGSHGRIAEGIGLAAQKDGFESWIAYGRYANKSSSNLIKIGTRYDCYEHWGESRIFDNHGLASRKATTDFVKKIDKIKPDLIQLHNIHGYYINYKILFQFIRKKQIPVVWTLHDCWSFTGHCAHFSFCGCGKWKTGCHNCPQKKVYPSSFLFDRSKKNFIEKKTYFNSIQNLTIITVSQWLNDLVSESFLKEHNRVVIRNGIDTDVFAPCSNAEEIRKRIGVREDETMLLGVASVWNDRKGFHDLIELSKHLSAKEKIVLIGLSRKQIASLPPNMIGLERTESTKQLAEFYSAADLFLNLTYEDSFPTTNLESLACGTPCLTYRTGGSPESIMPQTGFVVPQRDYTALIQCITLARSSGKQTYSSACRNYALAHFCQNNQFHDYIRLYEAILKK